MADAGEESRYVNQRLAKAIDVRFIAAVPAVDVSEDVKYADEKLLSSLRSFNHGVGLNDIQRILDSTAQECLRNAKAGLAGPAGNKGSAVQFDGLKPV
jgi:hypothetical protein